MSDETTGATVRRLLSWGASNCDAAAAFREVVELLADANMQEADEGDRNDDKYARAVRAKTVLFLLATDLTHGKRWHDE